MSNKGLDSIAEKIRDLKDTFNVEWGNKSHPEAIDDEIGTRGFDQVMDQVFKLVECFGNHKLYPGVTFTRSGSLNSQCCLRSLPWDL